MSKTTLRQQTPDELSGEWYADLSDYLGSVEGFDEFVVPLISLLEALHWQGGSRRIIEALPFRPSRLTAADFRDTLARLGYETIAVKSSPPTINDRLLPALVIDRGGLVSVILDWGQEGYSMIDGQKPMMVQKQKKPRDGQVFIIRAIAKSDVQRKRRPNEWVRDAFRPFKKLIGAVLGVSLFINLLALIGPIAIMVIYDQVIGKESEQLLYVLVSGVLIAAVFEIGLRILRAWSQAYVGSRLDFLVGAQVFEHILHLPPTFTERAPVGGQITRLREFETFREAFTGPLASLIVDLPFTIIFVAAIAIIAGPLAIIPVVLAGIYLLLAFIVMPELRARNRKAGEARSNRHSFLVELMWWMRLIKQNGGENKWRERARTLSADAAYANLAVARHFAMSQNIAQTLMTLAGIATLGFGVLQAMDGSMSLGALIATMILVWRVLAPIQSLFGLAQRIEQLQQSVEQLVGVLNFDMEQQPNDAPTTSIRFKGEIDLNRVSMRYSSDANAALLGISLKINPGEVIGVVGDSGSGKSTLAKLILGLYRPQGGTVSIDGIDIRQLRPITLRQTIAYVPQRNHAFPGTILENIRLGDPGASIARVREACRKAGLLHKIDALPRGFDSAFKDGLQSFLPAGFLRQICLARAFLRDAPIYVLDEPALALDDPDERQLLQTIEKLRGKATVIMITQRPSHMRLCDKLVVLDNGQVQKFGPPEQVLAAPARPNAPSSTGVPAR